MAHDGIVKTDIATGGTLLYLVGFKYLTAHCGSTAYLADTAKAYNTSYFVDATIVAMVYLDGFYGDAVGSEGKLDSYRGFLVELGYLL